MKLIKLLPLLFIFVLSSCTLDPGTTSYTNVVVPIGERNVPQIGNVDVPINIQARASLDNGCWKNVHFIFIQRDDRTYEMTALADFESNGVCPAVVVSGDTTVTFTPERQGNHIITFWMTPTVSERDTILVGEALEAR